MTPEVQAILWTALFVGSILASAVISGMEMGCYALNRVRLDVRASGPTPDRLAVMLRREIARPQRLLVTVLVGNNVAHYLSAMATSELFARAGLSESAVAAISAGVLAPLLFIFAEAVPKELYRIGADRLTPRGAPALYVLRLVLQAVGVMAVTRGLIALVERAAGMQGEAAADPRQRIVQLLKEGAGHGVLSESQVTLLDRALVLREITVADEMVPWSAVRTIPGTVDRERALRRIGPTAHSRLVVVDRGGRVEGVVRHLDLHTRAGETLTALLLEPARLAPGMKIRPALEAVKASPAGLGVIQDASGRPLGLVTAKDLIEPLTGPLVDL